MASLAAKPASLVREIDTTGIPFDCASKYVIGEVGVWPNMCLMLY